MGKNNQAVFVVFSDDWGVHPSSCQHLFKRIAEKHEVIWVNTVGMRLPTVSAYDIKKIFTKLVKWFIPVTIVNGLKLTVYNPVMLPFSNIKLVRGINKFFLTNGLKSLLASTRAEKVTILTTVPNISDILDSFPKATVVYYCVDDFTQWPGLMHDLVIQMEQELLTKTNIFIAASKKLLELKGSGCKKSYVLTHGVDTAHFSRREIAHTLANLKKPIVGFYGLIDERVDLDLISYLASQRPSWTIAMIGKEAADTSRLKNIKNIVFTGEVSYNDIPSYVNGFSVCLLPYKISGCTITISPLKLKEYLASGKPVISADIPGVSEYKDFICLAINREDFLTGIEGLLQNDSPEKAVQRRKLVEKESWENKAQQMLACMEENNAI